MISKDSESSFILIISDLSERHLSFCERLRMNTDSVAESLTLDEGVETVVVASTS
jgi:hypothetical protein